LERLSRLGLVGASRPYAERGSAPHHWWPTKVADAWARGAPVPRGGEREAPNEAFLAHAAAVTGLYIALAKLGPSLGFEVASCTREIEAKEDVTPPFHTGPTGRIVPDLTVVLRWGEATYHAFIEVDLGTIMVS